MDITACRNVFVSDCDIATGDDAICIKSENPYGELLPTKNITVTNCVLSTCCNGFKVGTATHGRVENIVFSNSVIYNDDSAALNKRATSGIALEVVDGGSMHGVAISNIRMQNARTPIFVRLGRRTPGAGSSLGNIRIDNVHATGSLLTSSITGLRDMIVEDVTISNSSFHTQENGLAEWTRRTIPEQEASYPEARMFGRLPASGLYVRHARAVRLYNVEVRTELSEQRPAVVCDAVQDLDLHALHTSVPSSPEPVVDLRNCREVFLHGTRAPAGTGNFLRVSGEASAEISLTANELTRATTPVGFADGASPNAIISP
jgi:polygalacturonase